jgi:His/Glu/Gln/Arg/opine family amino acid ABC transporter permease subunit
VQKQERPPFWRNGTVLKWSAQLIFLAGVVALFAWVVPEVQSNIDSRGLKFLKWEWLSSQLGFLIREGIDTDPATGARTFLVGMVNTLRVTVSGIIAATILGTIIGISRLSSNWIVTKLATVYIESLRNIPLLLQMFFWSAIVATFGVMEPQDPEALDIGRYWAVATRKGVGLSWIQPWGGFYQWIIFVIVGAWGARVVYRRLEARREEEGVETHPFRWAGAVFLVFAVIGWFAHPALGWVGHLFEFVGDVVGAIPTLLFQFVLAGAAVAAAGWWIKRFLDDRRTPAGLAKLTDDDWFRMILAGFLGLVAAAFFLIISPLPNKALEITESFFVDWAAPKFDATTNVLDVPIAEIEAQVAGGESLESIAAARGVAPKKLVDGLTTGVAEDLDDALEVGTLTPAQLGAELRQIESRADNPLRWSRTGVVARGQSFQDLDRNGGITITPGFFAVWIAVTLYTASFIAEVVRAGILAVSKGQTEAASAIGLTRRQSLRFVVLPQAFRIIFPPLGNQYLNLFKNTSLGIAVAFPDIVSVGITTSNQTGNTLPVILLWMGFYLTGSLVLSSVVNYYNRRLALVER